MFRSRNLTASPRRRAVILMVVLVLLTLFAIVGLAFVLYANSEAESSRVYRESFTLVDNRPDISPDLLASWSVGQLAFDVPEPTASAANPVPAAGFSALRGHSLGRDIYGWNSNLPGANIYPFNGVGHLHGTASNPFNVDDHTLLSYVPYTSDGFVRDPERAGTRANLTAPMAPYAGGWNSSYTYPDGNHVFLGAFDADMNVLARSFWRPALLPTTSTGNPCLPLDPTKPSYWTWFANANGAETVPASIRYASLRPRPADMLPGFPGPKAGGDVRNLPYNDLNPAIPRLNDSVWMDLDYPIQVAGDGTKFKPLFAFFIADLDGRVNLNANGNIRGTGNASLSDQGWGKWEVNLSKLGGTATEWPSLFVGSGANAGRYGADQQPAAANSAAASGRSPHVYGPVDFDGSDDTGPGNIGGNPVANPLTLPGYINYTAFPKFPAGYNNGFPPERTNHPLNYNSDYPAGDDTRFAANNLVALFNSNSSNIAGPSGTLLGKLMPTSMATFHLRNLFTTESAALDRPALTPGVYDRTAAGTPYGYGPAPLGANAHLPPQGALMNFPPFQGPPAVNKLGQPVPASSEFMNLDWRSADAALGKVDLNRYLPPYPHQGQGTTPVATANNPAPLTATPNDRFDDGGPLQAQFLAAQGARQQLANDIYRALLRVTSVPAPAAPAAPTPAELAPRRWLAQLAVNIVDFIDEDEISTPFNFYNATDGLAPANIGALQNNPTTGTKNDPELPQFWVFGTELPRVVINEVLAEYQGPVTAGKAFNVRVFAELYSPMPSAAQLGGAYPGTTQAMDNPANSAPAGSGLALWVGPNAANPTGYAPYNVVLADTNTTAGTGGLLTPPSPTPYNNDNVLGTPNNPRQVAPGGPVSAEFGDPVAFQTIDSKPAPFAIAPQQFVLVGPPGGDYGGTFAVQKAATNGVVPAGTPTVTSSNMQYSVTSNGAAPAVWTPPGDNVNGISVVLRRLANPHLPYNGQPLLANGNLNPAYNPYITVDYMRSVPVNLADTTAPGKYTSTEKQQPYASAVAQDIPLASLQGYCPAPAGTNPGVYTTFGWPNTSPPPPASSAAFPPAPGTAPPAPAVVPYNWLVHLDRQLINPLELLHVSGFAPFQLTSRFSPTAGVTGGQRVNWYNESTRLYRALEVLSTRDRAAGLSFGGRRPGMININTVWNVETLRALADAQMANGFYGGAGTPDKNVDAIFARLLQLRSPSLQALDPVLGIVKGEDRPFLSLGIGNLPANDPSALLDDGQPKPTNTGVEDTFLRSFTGSGKPTDPRLFDVPPPAAGALHPYQTTELMTKIFGNVTTRSNVFAVWVTVGFFRVPDPVQYVGGGPAGTGPVRLAEEIGYSTGTNIRHKIFAVVDRSRMTIARRSVTTLTAQVAAASLFQPTAVPVGATSGTTGLNAVPWQIQVGSMLIIDNGTPSEETIVVQQVGPGNTITATFEKAHLSAAPTVQIAGNPGPQAGWTINRPGYAKLVPTYSILQ